MIALAAALLTAPAARAADFLRQEMAEAAKEIKKRLDDRGDKALVINPRAAEVLVQGRSAQLIRRRESFQDLVRPELF